MYILTSLILLGFMFYIERKRKNNSKFVCMGSYIGAFKSYYKGVYFVFIPFIFAFCTLTILYLMNKFNLIDLGSVNANIIYIIYTSGIVPIIEEYFYRFLPYEIFGINKKYANVVIVLVSSLIFIMFHSLKGIEYLFMFVMAIILSIIYLKTRNISYSVMCHALYNLSMNLYYYSGVSYAYYALVIFGLVGGVLCIVKRH